MGPPSDRPFAVGASIGAAVTSAALVLRLAWGAPFDRLVASATVVGAIVAAITAHVASLLPGPDAPYAGDDARMVAWIIGGVAALYVATPFLQIFTRTGRVRFSYPVLFEHSWNNAFVGAIALLFTGAAWAVLGIWAALFSIVDIDVFAELFGSTPFVITFSFTGFGAGLALGRASEATIATLRRVTLLMAQLLLPVVCVVALLFLAVLPATGLTPLWKTGSATPLVLSLLAVLAVSLNALHEDGQRPPPPRWTSWLVRAAAVSMPVYAGIALRASTLRIDQYGLSPTRIYAICLIAIAGVFSCGYAIAALRRRADWMRGLEPANVVGALFAAAIAVAIALPPLDPLRLSALDQFGRFASRRVPAADFDFAALRFQLGRYGWERLRAIEALSDHPEAAAAHAAIADVRAAASHWQLERPDPVRARDLHFTIVPAGATTPDGFVEAILAAAPSLARECKREPTCTLIAVDLDADARDEWCVVALMGWYENVSGHCWTMGGERAWRSIGRLALRGDSMPGSDVQQLLRSAPLPLRPPRYREIELRAGTTLVVTPEP
ncbi:MAG: hypothetical protein DCC71_04935 [Proteobacteria bacterium]|nr:MAG: hypothetical protein DCC71_04935 [Pseudomonadota bacterium]